MTKRRAFRAIVTDHSGDRIIGEKDTFAWNSAIRATESIVREYARSKFCHFTGAQPVVGETVPVAHDAQPERIYRRHWENSTGEQLAALVWEVL